MEDEKKAVRSAKEEGKNRYEKFKEIIDKFGESFDAPVSPLGISNLLVLWIVVLGLATTAWLSFLIELLSRVFSKKN
jgi:hypothetical protein